MPNESALRHYHLADRVRVVEDGHVCLDRTLEQLDIEVEFVELPAGLSGYVRNDREVAVSSRCENAARRFAVAHEVAHVLFRRLDWEWVEEVGTEWLADSFARYLLFPPAHVDATMGLPANEVSLIHEVPEEVVLLERAARTGNPEIQVLGDRVLCIRCGDRGHFPACACTTLREEFLSHRLARL